MRPGAAVLAGLVAVLCAVSVVREPAAQPATGGAGPAVVLPSGDGSGDAATEAAPEPVAAPFAHVRRVMIDPGHGGTDSGCVGAAGIAEKELTLKTARRLRDALEDRVEWVGLTRDGDTYPTLEERTWMANLADADVLISVHFNCAPNDRAEGIEVFFLHPDGTVPGDVVPGLEHLSSSRVVVEYGVAGDLLATILEDLRREGATWRAATLADALQAALVRATGTVDRGVRQDRFRVLRGARMPAVVTELGFLTHPREGKIVLTSGRLDELVAGLVAGLEAYDTSSPASSNWN